MTERRIEFEPGEDFATYAIQIDGVTFGRVKRIVQRSAHAPAEQLDIDLGSPFADYVPRRGTVVLPAEILWEVVKAPCGQSHPPFRRRVEAAHWMLDVWLERHPEKRCTRCHESLCRGCAVSEEVPVPARHAHAR